MIGGEGGSPPKIGLCESFLVYPYTVLYSLQDGRTPLMEALSEGHVECVRLLLDKGALVDHQDNVSAVGCLTNDMLLSCSLWHKYIQ